MAFETGTPTDLQDLVSKLFTFLTGLTPAWVQDEFDGTNNYGTIHNSTSSVYVSFRWDDSPGTDLAIYHSLGWTTSLEPHQQDDDSGNGDTTTPINIDRRCNLLSSGPYTGYTFFASEAAPFYCHVVVEHSSGQFRHFGFGQMNKVGDWTGGEYCYGHHWAQGASSADVPTANAHAWGWDGIGTTTSIAGTIHAEGLDQQGASEKWIVLTGATTGGTDRAAVTRQVALGSSRSGLWTHYLSWLTTAQLNLYKPLIPIGAVFRDTSTSPDTWYLLGTQPDVAIINIANFSAGDDITVGSDTWRVFPWVRKQFLENDTEESRNAGIAYKNFA